MPIWPFKRRRVEEPQPADVRDRLLAAAASGSWPKLRSLCEQNKHVVAQNLDLMRNVPEAIRGDPESVEHYVDRLGTVAQCLASECDAPELWYALCGSPDENPVVRWNFWIQEFPRRMEQLEHDELIAEVKVFIEEAQSLQGNAVRQNEAVLQGRLGELLFHSGQAHAAIEPFQRALGLCRSGSDLDGEVTYLSDILEVHRFLGRHADAVGIAQELVQLYDRSGQHSGSFSRAAERLTHGEPLCRVVCVRDDDEFEVEDVQNVADGRYEFHFRRNRIALQKSAVLVEQGNALASNAQYAEALDKYREASDVDAYDPNPVYQSACCLLDLGSFRQAKEAFEEVERLAPGWFRCRSDAWIADGLAAGTVSEEQYQLLRLLEDGQPTPKQALKKVQQGIERSPDFAPFYLVLGNLRCDRNENEQAIAAYRTGLELVAEPDLETRLLCALAAMLLPEQPERRSLLQRAIGLKGNLVAIATARLMALQDEG